MHCMSVGSMQVTENVFEREQRRISNDAARQAVVGSAAVCMAALLHAILDSATHVHVLDYASRWAQLRSCSQLSRFDMPTPPSASDGAT
jgi:hypothetical protein